MNANLVDVNMMTRAIELAARGQGRVEPNPMVGCVIARADQIIGEGWHNDFGGPHAEVAAIQSAKQDLQLSTIYVTLEPCCHHGKTPPCSEAIRKAGISRVVVAQQDPFPQVAGKGIAELRNAGLQVDLGVCESEAELLIAPFRKRIVTGRPWVIAKWAMTLDGKIATHTGNSQWISSEASRQIVHCLRARVDAILVGSGTAAKDNPQLTARPAGVRQAARVVVDSNATLALSSQLVKTARETPVLVAVKTGGDPQRQQALEAAGCQLVQCDGDDHLQRLDSLLRQLSGRSMTNLLVEGGGGLLGNLLQIHQIDEVHAFIAPKLAGGQTAISPIGGAGFDTMDQAIELKSPQTQFVGPDLYIHGHLAAPKPNPLED
ncbi:MAG: bifunctional diaminohydroxyphosphoribosylaminopyrimidine deaminase/5-amino-6-(5-phosphoribosylamino)uracil reductase RibD [Pirellulaceae bacterium]|nr:bifunctional diaminohydroxyphosphoribosylaminopyrimidine deaminase/5-amino-6-(5-phosphoribosylamino)uracil reductase RibD [Pirellulaceae bacterium]